MLPKRLLLIAILIFIIPLFYLFPGVGLSSRVAWGLYVAGMAGICLMVCLSLENLRQRALAVPAIFLYSTLLEGINTSTPPVSAAWMM